MACQSLLWRVLVINGRPYANGSVGRTRRQVSSFSLLSILFTYLVSGDRMHLVMYLSGCAAKLVTGCNVVASVSVLE